MATDRPGTAEAPSVQTHYRPEPLSQRKLFDPASGAWIEAAVHARSELRPGAEIPGPAVIVEDETTTLVTNGFGATINGLGQIVLARKETAA